MNKEELKQDTDCINPMLLWVRCWCVYLLGYYLDCFFNLLNHALSPMVCDIKIK